MKPVKKGLVVTGQSLTFSQQPQVDAEGQTALRRFETRVGAGHGAVNDGGLGSIPGIIEYQTTAGAMANGVRTACAACKHFDQKAWHQFLAVSTGPGSKAEDRETINGMRARLMMAGYGPEDDKGELDVEAALASFGICRVLSDWIEGALKVRDPIHWPVVVGRDATCPTYVQAREHRMEVTTPAAPFGLYAPRDLDAKKIGAARYDAVLQGASGKIIK
jgi:hypothetical protein